MKKIKYIFTILSILSVCSVQANVEPELEKAVVSEHKTYKDFKENFQFLIALMAKEGSGISRDSNVSDTHWFCLHNQHLIKMFNNNQKYKKQFDQEFAKEFQNFDDALKGFKKFDQDQKQICENAQIEYDQI